MHTVKRVCTLVLTGLLALPMAAPAGAAAASFSDLPSSHWAYIAMTEAAGYGILQGTGANTMSPSAPLTWPQFLAMAARAFAPEEYARSAASGAAWDQAGLDAARSAGLLEGLDEAALTGAEIQEEQFWEKVERGEAAYEDYYKQDFWLNFQGDNARKHILLFGDESKSRFASQEEAAAAMTTVTVPVWQLSGGEKVSSTLTLSVHAALAEDVKEIFTEIYNDPERFPIHDVGGYAWRGDSATGEHNCGTAIDINANENYQIRDGQVLAGSCWEPGSNAYSISPDSSVVRIFAEHGWSWGGDAWAYSSDDSEGYHDYMHFSYMGE